MELSIERLEMEKRNVRRKLAEKVISYNLRKVIK